MSSVLERQEKIDLALNLEPLSFSGTPIFRLKAGDVKIELCYKGDDLEEVKKFLKDYFKKFDSFHEAPDVIVQYEKLPGKFGDFRWNMWNDWEHEIEFRKGDLYDVVIQRDFVGKTNKSGDRFYAYGPEWSKGTCDSIDNIVSYVLGRKLIKYNGVILHAASVSFNDSAYVFFGASGAGKSTLAELAYKLNGLRVISSDQVLIRYKNNQLVAHLMPTTIPEFHLDHPAREERELPVRSILHLTQKGGVDFEFRELTSMEWIKVFMRELVYRPEFSEGQDLLDLSLKIAGDSAIIRGEMSYKKGSDFFSALLKQDKFHD